MIIAPPGWECQPEEPPGSTVICAMATSVPTWSGMVPSDTSVPRAKGTFVRCDGGVAKTVPPYTAAPRTLRRRTQTHFDFTAPPLRTRLPRQRGWGPFGVLRGNHLVVARGASRQPRPQQR